MLVMACFVFRHQLQVIAAAAHQGGSVRDYRDPDLNSAQRPVARGIVAFSLKVLAVVTLGTSCPGPGTCAYPRFWKATPGIPTLTSSAYSPPVGYIRGVTF